MSYLLETGEDKDSLLKDLKMVAEDLEEFIMNTGDADGDLTPLLQHLEEVTGKHA